MSHQSEQAQSLAICRVAAANADEFATLVVATARPDVWLAVLSTTDAAERDNLVSPSRLKAFAARMHPEAVLCILTTRRTPRGCGRRWRTS